MKEVRIIISSTNARFLHFPTLYYTFLISSSNLWKRVVMAVMEFRSFDGGEFSSLPQTTHALAAGVGIDFLSTWPKRF